jgi:hypothetical protein
MCVWVQRFLVSDEQNDHTQGFRTQDSRTQEVKKSRSHKAGGPDPIREAKSCGPLKPGNLD